MGEAPWQSRRLSRHPNRPPPGPSDKDLVGGFSSPTNLYGDAFEMFDHSRGGNDIMVGDRVQWFDFIHTTYKGGFARIVVARMQELLRTFNTPGRNIPH